MALDFSGVEGSGMRGLKCLNSLTVLPLSAFEGFNLRLSCDKRNCGFYG